MKRREVLAALAAVFVPPLGPARARDVVEWVVPFQEGGGTDVWARFVARWLSETMTGGPEVRLRNLSGGNSTRAANFFSAEARADGRMLLGTTGSTLFAALLGDRRVQYSYDEWRILAAMASGGVVYVPASLGVSSMAELVARGAQVHFGSIGAASLDIVPLLALEMLGLDVAAMFGLSSRNAARVGVASGEFDIDYQTTGAFREKVRAQAASGEIVPLMTLGAPDGMARDPAFPALPSFFEAYRQVHGREPDGETWAAWLSLFRTGFSAQKMVFLSGAVPEERAAPFLAAFERIAADPRFRREAADLIGPYPLRVGADARAAQAAAMTMSPAVRDWTRDWLDRRFRITP